MVCRGTFPGALRVPGYGFALRRTSIFIMVAAQWAFADGA